MQIQETDGSLAYYSYDQDPGFQSERRSDRGHNFFESTDSPRDAESPISIKIINHKEESKNLFSSWAPWASNRSFLLLVRRFGK
jgi:hypothetical protein